MCIYINRKKGSCIYICIYIYTHCRVGVRQAAKSHAQISNDAQIHPRVFGIMWVALPVLSVTWSERRSGPSTFRNGGKEVKTISIMEMDNNDILYKGNSWDNYRVYKKMIKNVASCDQTWLLGKTKLVPLFYL